MARTGTPSALKRFSGMIAQEHGVYVSLLEDPRLPRIVAARKCGLQGAGALTHHSGVECGGRG